MKNVINVFGMEIAKRGTINGIKEEAETKIKASEKKFKIAAVTGSSTTAAAAITAVVLGMLNKNKKNQLEQITAANKTTEKIIVTYAPISKEPKEWNTSYTKYFTYSEKGEMTPVAGITTEDGKDTKAPAFTAGKFFSRKEETIETPAAE